MEEVDNICTQDGTVDLQKKPANKKNTGNWRACTFILGYQLLEKIAFWGVAVNMATYLEEQFDQGNIAAANGVTNWSATSSITPLIGAFLADTYFGKYMTIVLFSTVYVLGITLLALTSFLTVLKPYCDYYGHCHPTHLQTSVLFVALYMIAFGCGSIRPCISSFGAEQFDKTDRIEKKKQTYFFNLLFMMFNIGMLISTSIVAWIEKHIGWAWGFGICSASMIGGLVAFLLGSWSYRNHEPEGSSLTRILQVLVSSCRKLGVHVPEDKSLLFEDNVDVDITNVSYKKPYKLEHSNDLSFFDKAAVEMSDDRMPNGSTNPWRLCTVTQVEELKSIIRLLPIWAFGICFAVVFSQMTSMFVLQGNNMDQHLTEDFTVPSGSLSSFNALGVIIGTATYDKLIVPWAKRFTGHEEGLTQLQRMGIGLLLSVLTMVNAALIEAYRLSIVKLAPLSVLWLVPQQFLLGIAEVFAYVGELELFYHQAPNSLRSLCSALFLSTYAVGGYFSSLLVTIVTKVTTKNGNLGWLPNNLNMGHLDYFYWMLALLNLLNFFFFVWTARRFTYRKVINNTA